MDNPLLSVIATLLPVVAGACVTVAPIVASIVKHRRELLSTAPILIGVIGEIPEPLKVFRDFSSARRAKLCPEPVVVVHVRTLSYGLRKCDFVSVQSKRTDPKVFYYKDKFWEQLAADYATIDSKR